MIQYLHKLGLNNQQRQDIDMIKILIVEDEEPIANLIRMNLRKAGYHCSCAGDGNTAADQMASESFDLILLDIMLPGINGFELLEYARSMEIPVIFITAMSSTDSKVKGLRKGADDYITKPFSVRELVARVKANLRKVEVVSNNQYSSNVGNKKKESKIVVGDLELDLDKFEVKVRGKIIDLTLREFEVLKFLASQPEQVVTRETLLEKVWGYEYYGDIRTVDVTVRRIRI